MAFQAFFERGSQRKIARVAKQPQPPPVRRVCITHPGVEVGIAKGAAWSEHSEGVGTGSEAAKADRPS
jgi:hypothetical protein